MKASKQKPNQTKLMHRARGRTLKIFLWPPQHLHTCTHTHINTHTLTSLQACHPHYFIEAESLSTGKNPNLPEVHPWHTGCLLGICALVWKHCPLSASPLCYSMGHILQGTRLCNHLSRTGSLTLSCQEGGSGCFRGCRPHLLHCSFSLQQNCSSDVT